MKAMSEESIKHEIRKLTQKCSRQMYLAMQKVGIKDDNTQPSDSPIVSPNNKNRQSTVPDLGSENN